MRTVTRLALLLPLGLLGPWGLSSARAEGARIVDAPGLPPFQDLQAAVDAATDGDTILVAGGTYAGFVIQDKRLQVVGVPGQSVSIEGTVSVLNLAAGRSVLLSGLDVTGASVKPASLPALVVTGCAGHVRVEGCTLAGGAGVPEGDTSEPFGDGGHAVVLQASPRVVFSDCTLAGGDGGGDQLFCYDCTGGDGGLGLRLNQSTPALYGCQVLGGAGGDNGLYGGQGAHGCRLLNSWMFAAGSTFAGGAGGDAWDFVAAFPGDGGDGLFVDGGARAELRDNAYAGGAGGVSIVFPSNNGSPGAPKGGAGTFVEHPGSARGFTAFRLAIDDGLIQVVVQGEPGDEVWVRAGAAPAFLPATPTTGVSLVAPSFVTKAPLGVVPGSGTLLVTLRAPDLSSQADRLLWMQGFGRDALGQPWLAGPMHTLVLDRHAPPDCNGNLQSDLVDTITGASPDCGPNLVPDSCDPDCNANGVPDDCDIAAGTAGDCNGNGLPDACDIAAGTSVDCNGNGVPDDCDIAAGTSPDANGNGVPDECEPSVTWWVDASAPPGGNGSLAAPFQTIRAGVLAAIDGDEVVVRDGLYVGPDNRGIFFDGRAIVVRSQNGAAGCVVDLQGAGWGFDLNGIGLVARLEGFTFKNGSSVSGGAVRTTYSNAVVRGCVFESCSSSYEGGALRLSSGAPLVEDCVFRGNSAVTASAFSGFGGAVSVSGNVGSSGLTRIRRCTFEDNSANHGGALSLDHEFPVHVSHCLFLGNDAVLRGGAIHNGKHAFLGGIATIDDCLFAGNSAGEAGGAIHSAPSVLNYGTDLRVHGSTFSGNVSGLIGGGLAVRFAGSALLANCLLWDDAAGLGAELALDDGGNTTWGIPKLSVVHSLVAGESAGVLQNGSTQLTWGAGNLDVDPQFADPDGPDNDPLTLDDNDYRPIAGSPANDAGDNARVPADVNDIDGDGNTGEPTPLDLDLTPRFVEDPSAPNVGAGTPPLVDLGCYEHP